MFGAQIEYGDDDEYARIVDNFAELIPARGVGQAGDGVREGQGKAQMEIDA